MSRLTGCCCCFDLRDGARAVGITLMFLYGLGIIKGFGSMVINLQREDGRIIEEEVIEWVIDLGMGILGLVMNALLVYGVNKNRRGMILGWLIFFVILFGFQTAGVVICFIFACIRCSWWVPLLVLGVGGALTGVFWYWFVVVLHYYRDLKVQNRFVYLRNDNQCEKHDLWDDRVTCGGN